MTTQNQFSAPITYFLQEGRENLRDCLKIAFLTAKIQNISKIIIFTARGQGVRLALEEFCPQQEYRHIQPIAVTFPNGKEFTNPDRTPLEVAIDEENLELFKRSNVPLVRAHLPFDPISTLYQHHTGSLGQDLSLIGETLNMFCGGMSLCVQAILMACDAGSVDLAEHVIAVTADTAILAQATSTRRMLRELIIREVLCKPAVLTIGRKEVSDKFSSQMQLEMPSPVQKLDSGSGEAQPNIGDPTTR